MLMPTASKSLKGKIEQAKQNRLIFLKPWDLDFVQEELKNRQKGGVIYENSK